MTCRKLTVIAWLGLLIAMQNTPAWTFTTPLGDPPLSLCQFDAFVTAGPMPRVGDLLAIGAYTYARSSMCGFTFDALYVTRLRSSCDSMSLPGPVIATHAVLVGSTFEITSTAGVCITLCRCD